MAVDQVRQPFFCNAAAQAAAVEALRHQDEVARARGAQPRRAARRWRTGCAASASSPRESQANFLWFDLPGRDPRDEERRRGERELVRALAERAILVRSGTALGRPGALRVTVGTEAENMRLLEALGALL